MVDNSSWLIKVFQIFSTNWMLLLFPLNFTLKLNLLLVHSSKTMFKVDSIRISLSFQATSKENVSHHVSPHPFTIKESSQGKWLELVLFRCVESSVSLISSYNIFLMLPCYLGITLLLKKTTTTTIILRWTLSLRLVALILIEAVQYQITDFEKYC